MNTCYVCGATDRHLESIITEQKLEWICDARLCREAWDVYHAEENTRTMEDIYVSLLSERDTDPGGEQ